MALFNPSDILLPKKGCDMTKWAVVACDQYTSEPKYWSDLKEFVGGAPSTLKITLPEIYLEESGVEDRIKNINETMLSYLDSGIFESVKNSFIYVERTDSLGKIRKGVVGAADLLEYDYNKGSKSKIRATEGTILDRLPPRVKVRENAALELPHIMILIDDPDKTVIEPLENKQKTPIYDFKLFGESGSIKGFALDDTAAAEIQKAIEKLSDSETFNEKYGTAETSPLVFAVGDGNHSLATAKQIYDNLKNTLPEEEYLNHPARYALVEIVNIYDESLFFEGIHRVVFGVDRDDFLGGMIETLGLSVTKSEQYFDFVSDGEVIRYYMSKKSSTLAVGSLQNFIDKYLANNAGRVDYIHGEDVVKKLSTGNDLGFILPSVNKADFFKTVILDGSLPRKTFSMGHAADKRFYLEARKIR